MPFLNAEKFIEEAIRSVLDQTYENWELLLIDDGSSDSSTEIACLYSERYPEKVRYLEHDGHQNRGASASRNLGILHAQGKYISFLDADDVYLPHKLDQQVPMLEAQPEAAVLCGNALYWYSWTGIPEDIARDSIRELGVKSNTLIRPPELLTRILQRKAAVPCICSLLVRQEVIKRVGGFEESFRYIYTDQVFYSKMFIEAPVLITNECWDMYRQHPNSCCNIVKIAGQSDSARLNFLNWLERYLYKQEIKDLEVWKALRQELWPYRYPISYRVVSYIRRIMRRIKRISRLIARSILTAPMRRRLGAHGVVRQ
ncbi:MAG TPA: glycosyltransferase family A protein [Thermodesulfobacteriota bacterium]|nr:glycosyltransferase family A protein [Thermodesulfobacteriota bacterium]